MEAESMLHTVVVYVLKEMSLKLGFEMLVIWLLRVVPERLTRPARKSSLRRG